MNISKGERSYSMSTRRHSRKSHHSSSRSRGHKHRRHSHLHVSFADHNPHATKPYITEYDFDQNEPVTSSSSASHTIGMRSTLPPTSHLDGRSNVMSDRDIFKPQLAEGKTRVSHRTKRDVYNLTDDIFEIVRRLDPMQIACSSDGMRLMNKIAKTQQLERLNVQIANHIVATETSSNNSKAYFTGSRGAKYYVASSGKRQYYGRLRRGLPQDDAPTAKSHSPKH